MRALVLELNDDRDIIIRARGNVKIKKPSFSMSHLCVLARRNQVWPVERRWADLDIVIRKCAQDSTGLKALSSVYVDLLLSVGAASFDKPAYHIAEVVDPKVDGAPLVRGQGNAQAYLPSPEQRQKTQLRSALRR